jgi:putative oxidoreductase
MTTTHVGIAERIAYGRPLDLDSERARVQVEPRAGTALVARLLLSVPFLVNGISKLTDPGTNIAYMQSAGIPSSEILVYLAGIAELAGGLMVAAGLLGRLGAVVLMLFLIPTTLVFHDFWNLEGPERMMQQVQFLKNLAIFGGLGLLFAYGPGRYSVDGRLRRPWQA